MITNKSISVQVADVSASLIVDDVLYPDVELFFSSFLCQLDPVYTLHVHVTDDLSIVPQEKSDPISFEGNVLSVSSDEFYGTMNYKTNVGALYVKSTWAVGAISNFLRNIYSVNVFSKGGVMLHAAGLVKDNNAYIFFGPSESGKSTVAQLSRECVLLSDELVAVLPSEEGFKAYGTPTWGNSAYEEQNTSAIPKGQACPGFELKGLYRLVKDTEVYLKKLSTSAAAAELYTLPGVYDRELFIADLLKSCTDLAITVPCYELHFRKDDSFWKVIDAHFE